MSFQDDVTLIANRLNKKSLEKPISAKAIESAQSALRILKYQHPHGTFGKGDNELKRACALLEYTTQDVDGTKIPMSVLAKASFMKEKDFIRFHGQLRHFRNSATKPSKKTAPEKVVSTFPALALKLGPFVADSAGVANRAQRLYNDIARFCKKNPDQLRDMTRHRQIYEAACFFDVATRDSTPEAQGPSNDDVTKQLQVSTVVDLSRSFTMDEFKSVMDHIHSILEQMNPDNASGSDTKHQSTGKSKKRQHSDLKESTVPKRAKPLILSTQRAVSNLTQELLQKSGESLDLAQLEDSIFPEASKRSKTSSVSLASSGFLEWKRSVLSRAVEAATVAIRESVAKSEPAGESLPRSRALQHAATTVLQNCKIIGVGNGNGE